MRQLLGVLGDPVEHSLSPMMHNRWYDLLQVEHHYHAFHLTNERLGEGIQAIKTLGIKGVNVTIPHKIEMIQKLDELDEEARELGAVNTVVNENGRLKGFNTDGRGLVAAIREKWPEALIGAKVLLVGAGGAALAVALTLAKSGVSEITLANRTMNKAASISEKCSKWTSSKAQSISDVEADLSPYSLIIHSTPIGMAPNWLDQIPFSLKTIKPGTSCIDLIYNPLKTRWLREAEEKGAQIMNGLPMLVHQGALSFEHWFGIKPETLSMIAYLTHLLEERHANR